MITKLGKSIHSDTLENKRRYSRNSASTVCSSAASTTKTSKIADVDARARCSGKRAATSNHLKSSRAFCLTSTGRRKVSAGK